tara:strand:- start:8767 stop:10047 length:1281 start_codon:yes stop_codon:yes gene_type:complete
MESPEPITLAAVLIGGLIASGAAVVAKGIYDSAVTGNWGFKYVHARDTANLLGSVVPAGEAMGLGNFVRRNTGQEEVELDGVGLALNILSGVMQVAGAAGATGGFGGGAFGGGGAGGDFGASGATAIATPGSNLGSEIAKQTLASPDAFNQFHNPLGISINEALSANLVDPASGIIKTYGLENIGTPAGAAGAAQGVKSVAELGGAAPTDAIAIGTAKTPGAVEQAMRQTNIANEMTFGDVKVPPANWVQRMGYGAQEGLKGARDSISEVYQAPFDALGENTTPAVGEFAKNATMEMGMNALAETGRDDPDYGRAILGGLAGAGASYAGASLLSPGKALANELQARGGRGMRAHPATVDPVAGTYGSAINRAVSGGTAGIGSAARAGVQTAMTPEPPVRNTPPVTNPYRMLYPQRYINRFNPRMLG